MLFFDTPTPFILTYPQEHTHTHTNMQIPSNHQTLYQTVEILGPEIDGDKGDLEVVLSPSPGSLVSGGDKGHREEGRRNTKPVGETQESQE